MELMRVLECYAQLIPKVVRREPNNGDVERWVTHRIGDTDYQIAQPVTFTPYASAAPCSARCHFCSENLRQSGQSHSSQMRPSGDYFVQLKSALTQLQNLPLAFSLSGLEATDDWDWFAQLIDVLAAHKRSSKVEQSVLYSNGAGMVHLRANAPLMTKLQAFELNWVELSRHHYDEKVNQSIMRFRPGLNIVANTALNEVVETINAISTVKLVCIVQAGGVADVEALLNYVSWARAIGVRQVIFRELSVLGDNYLKNTTFNYIADSRVSVAALARCFIAQELPALEFVQATLGYYFCNLVVKFRDVVITFESSSYVQLQQRHDSGRVYKLIFHANGNLCADWNPARHVLFSALGTL